MVLLKERWKTEAAYREMKNELGLDHYEGRRYTGFTHHVTAVLCTYAFVVAERDRAFPQKERDAKKLVRTGQRRQRHTAHSLPTARRLPAEVMPPWLAPFSALRPSASARGSFSAYSAHG